MIFRIWVYSVMSNALFFLIQMRYNEVFVFQAEHLRKKVTRFEDENESLMMQLKKMATRSRSTNPSRNFILNKYITLVLRQFIHK